MKRTILAALMIAAFACMTACDKDSGDTSSAFSSETDSSYYGVNYTDTGDSVASNGNSSVKIDHTSSAQKSEAESSQAASSKAQSTPSDKQGASSSESASSKATTKTVVTYYYYDDEGEHSTDTEIEVTSSSESTEQSSEASSKDTDTDVDSSQTQSSDPTSETESSSETDSAQSDTDSGEFTKDDLTITLNGVAVTFGMDIAEIEAAFDEQPIHIDNIHNANNPEFDIKTYNYEHFSIRVEPSEDGSVYTVTGIQIFDDSTPTDKGVTVGMSAQDAAVVYGDSVMICGDEYRYYIGSEYMYLYIQNDIVANIGYGIDPDIHTDSEQ